MEKERIQVMEEIKRLERELYLKKSYLASVEALEYGVTLPSLLGQGLEAQGWKKVFSKLIESIGLHSSGGNSVEDVQRERDRCNLSSIAISS